MSSKLRTIHLCSQIGALCLSWGNDHFRFTVCRCLGKDAVSVALRAVRLRRCILPQARYLGSGGTCPSAWLCWLVVQPGAWVTHRGLGRAVFWSFEMLFSEFSLKASVRRTWGADRAVSAQAGHCPFSLRGPGGEAIIVPPHTHREAVPEFRVRGW